MVIAAPFAEMGRVESRLIQEGLSPEAVAALTKAFLDDTLLIGNHSALRADCWLAYAGDVNTLPAMTMGFWRVPQRGGTAGERLAHLFQDGFAAGFRSVCVLGTTMPHLPVAFVQEAFGRLAFGANAVFGPTEAGSCYLIGLREIHPDLFADIPWGTDTVLQHLLVQAEKMGRTVALLPTGYNLNTLQDIQRLKRDLAREVAHAPVTASALGASDAQNQKL